MAASDDIQNAGEGIGTAFSNATTSANKSAATLKKLKTAFNDFKKIADSTTSAFLDSSQEFSKYNKILDSANQTAQHAAKYIKGGKTRQAFSLFSNSITGLLKAFLSYNDNQLAVYDRLSKLGASATFGADNIQKLMNQTSLWYSRFDGFTTSFEKLGTGLLTLGKTTGEAADQLSKVFHTEEVEDTFIRLGYSLEGLASVQTDYIKLQELSGIKVTGDAVKLQKESLEYATALKYLSALTGENVDKISQEMLAQSLDFKFQLRLSEVDKSTRDRLSATATLSSTLYGPEVGAAVRDFLANGFASVQKSEGLMVVTEGRIATWVSQLENGTITELEFNQKIARSLINFEKNQRENLKISDSYNQGMFMATRTIEGANQILQVDSKEGVNQLMTALVEKQDQADSLKNVVTAQIKAERASARLSSSVLHTISSPLNSALTTLTNLVKSTALIAAKLGNYIFGEQTEAFEAVITMFGSAGDIKKIQASLDKDIAKIDSSIKAQHSIGTATKLAKQQMESATAKQRVMQAKIVAGTSVSASEQAATQDEVYISEAKYRAAQQAEKRLFGKTTIELEEKKSSLEKRRGGTSAAITQREEEKQRVSQEGTLNKERVSKVIQFAGGVTGNFSNFEQINPALAEKVIRLAEKYHEMTGKKLNLTSGYRSAEEQQDMHEAWLAAGGNKDNQTVFTPKYGNLSIPGKTSRHTARGAVDIDADQLMQLGDQIIQGFGLHRPYIKNDPVHLEALPGAKNGGIFDGPSSGYPMLFHGTEAIVPLLDNKTMAIDLKNADASNSFDSIRSSLTKIKEANQAMPNKSTRNSGKAVATGLIDQIDTLISQVSQSNSIYSDIKLYMST